MGLKETYILVVKEDGVVKHKCQDNWEQMKRECKKHGLAIDFIKQQPKKLIIEIR